MAACLAAASTAVLSWARRRSYPNSCPLSRPSTRSPPARRGPETWRVDRPASLRAFIARPRLSSGPSSSNPIAAAIPTFQGGLLQENGSADWPRLDRFCDTQRRSPGLKAEPGGEIVAHAGWPGRAVADPARLGGRVPLVVLPAAVGQGQPLFTDLDHPLTLRLLECRGFASGFLTGAYLTRPAEDLPGGHRRGRWLARCQS